jgi:hypothetical protein
MSVGRRGYGMLKKEEKVIQPGEDNLRSRDMLRAQV